MPEGNFCLQMIEEGLSEVNESSLLSFAEKSPILTSYIPELPALACRTQHRFEFGNQDARQTNHGCCEDHHLEDYDLGPLCIAAFT